MQMYVPCADCILFGHIPCSEIVGSYSHSIFSTLRSLQSVFHNVCASSHSYQHCAGVESFPEHSCMHLSFLFLTVIRMISNHFGVTSIYISWSLVEVESFCVPVDHLFVSLGELLTSQCIFKLGYLSPIIVSLMVFILAVVYIVRCIVCKHFPSFYGLFLYSGGSFLCTSI